MPRVWTALVGTTSTLLTWRMTSSTSALAPGYNPDEFPVTNMVTGKLVTPLDVVPKRLKLETMP